MAQGRFRDCSGPLGAVHIGLQTPLATGLYYCTLCRVSKYNHTNFQLFIFKNEDYVAQWYFQGCLEPLGAVQDPQGQFIRGFKPPWPWDFTLIQFAGYLCASIPAFSSLSLYLKILWPPRDCFFFVPGKNLWQTLSHVLIHTLRSANQS